MDLSAVQIYYVPQVIPTIPYTLDPAKFGVTTNKVSALYINDMNGNRYNINVSDLNEYGSIQGSVRHAHDIWKITNDDRTKRLFVFVKRDGDLSRIGWFHYKWNSASRTANDESNKLQILDPTVFMGPNSISNIVVTPSTTAPAANIVFTEPSSVHALKYYVYIHTADTNQIQSLVPSGNGTITLNIVSGLSRGVTYTIYVVAVDKITFFSSPPSNSVDLIIPTVPEPPDNVVATFKSPTVVSLTITPGSDNGTPITGYRIDVWKNGTVLPQITIGTTTRDINVSRGDNYVFKVRSKNAKGISISSTDTYNMLIPYTNPTIDSIDITADRTNGSTIILNSVTGDDGGAPVSYTISSSGKSATGPLPLKLTGLIGGTSYICNVVATSGTPSNKSSIPFISQPINTINIPNQPVISIKQDVTGTAIITFPVPSTNGPLITSYKVYNGDNLLPLITSGSSTPYATIPTIVQSGIQTIKLNKLTNGTVYTIKVVAVNLRAYAPAPRPAPAARPAPAPRPAPAGAPAPARAPAPAPAPILGGDSVASVPVNITLITSPPDISGTPTVKIDASGNPVITFNTITNATATTPVEGYYVFTSATAPGPSVLPVNAINKTTSGTTTSITLSGLPGNTYTFRVRAYNTINNITASGKTLIKTNYSNPAASAAFITGAPAAPTNVSAVVDSTGATISFTASASTPLKGKATKYVVSDASGATVTNGTTDISGTKVTIHVSGLTNNNVYNFKITPYNGDYAGTPAAITMTAGPPGPIAVTYALISASSARITITPPTTGTNVVSYKVYTSASGGTATATSNTTSITISSISSGDNTYYIAASAGTVEGPRASITITAGTPNAPTSVKATIVSATQVSITFNESTTGPNVVTYKVYNGADRINVLGQGSSSPITATVTSGSSYAFNVVPYVGNPLFAGAPAAITVMVVGLPKVPTINSVDILDNTHVNIKFTPSASGSIAKLFRVYNDNDRISILGHGTTSPISATVDPTKTYKFTVVPYVDSLGSLAGTPVSYASMAVGLPNAPTNLKLTALTATSATITFTKPSSGAAIKTYKVYDGATAITTNPATVAANATSVVVTLAANKTYNIKIRAYVDTAVPPTVAGDFSEALIITTSKPGAPSVKSVYINTTNAARISFDPPTSGGTPTSYVGKAYTGTGSNAYTTGVVSGTAGNSSATYVDLPTLVTNSIYKFTVTASNYAGSTESPQHPSSVTPKAVGVTINNASKGQQYGGGKITEEVHMNAGAFSEFNNTLTDVLNTSALTKEKQQSLAKSYTYLQNLPVEERNVLVGGFASSWDQYMENNISGLYKLLKGGAGETPATTLVTSMTAFKNTPMTQTYASSLSNTYIALNTTNPPIDTLKNTYATVLNDVSNNWSAYEFGVLGYVIGPTYWTGTNYTNFINTVNILNYNGTNATILQNYIISYNTIKTMPIPLLDWATQNIGKTGHIQWKQLKNAIEDIITFPDPRNPYYNYYLSVNNV